MEQSRRQPGTYSEGLYNYYNYYSVDFTYAGYHKTFAAIKKHIEESIGLAVLCSTFQSEIVQLYIAMFDTTIFIKDGLIYVKTNHDTNKYDINSPTEFANFMAYLECLKP